MYKYLLIVVVFCLQVATLSAQSKTISGVIIDEDGETLPGASIIVKGTESNPVGTISSIDGSFSLSVPQGKNVLVISFIGFNNQEVDISGLSFITVTLMSDFKSLDEVVVTALGIKRDKKALGYAVQNVDGNSMQATSSMSPLEGLSGKASGLNVISSGSGPAGSTQVLIRGVSSLTGGNGALFVVDGVPLSNGGGASGGQYGGFDYGSGANNINPADVESVSVLKGGAAAALYGSRGQNGVIMITTKKGSRDKSVGVSLSSSFEISNPLIKPNLQNEYAQGSNGKYDAISYRSWGAKMTGQTVTNFLNQEQVLNGGAKHPYDEFLKTETTWNNTVTINKRGDKNGIYFSASNMDNKGKIPNSTFKKNSFAIRFDSELSDFLTLDAKANYIYQAAENRPNLAASPDNPFFLMNVMPRSVRMNQLKTYQTVDGAPVVWNSTYQVNDDGTVSWRDKAPVYAQAPLLQNPYWAVDLNNNMDDRSRILGFGELTMDVQKLLHLPFALSIKGKAGLDYIVDDRKRIVADKTYYKANGLAALNKNKSEFREENYDALITIGDEWNGFRVQSSFGGNIMKRTQTSVSTSSESGLINEVGPYVIQNFLNPLSAEGYSNKEIQSVYALFSADYKSKIFLDLSFRNDWSSSLSSANWSYQYPSVGLSWILSESLSLPGWLNYLKVRSSYGAVGSDADLSSFRYFQYSTNPNQYNGLPYAGISAKRANPDIKSEYTESVEFGLESSLLNNRMALDLTLYQMGTRDQILLVPLPQSTGNSSGYMNAGFIRNKGIEMAMSGDVVKTQDFNLNLGLNVTYQKAEVEELHEEIDRLYLSGVGSFSVNAIRYQPAGVFSGSAFARDEQGRLIVDEENLPKIATTEDGAIDTEQMLGNAYPDWMLGFNGRARYKNLGLQFSIDSKLGHDIYSFSNKVGAEYGTLAFTTQGRDEWTKAKEIAAVTGTVPNDGFQVIGVKDGVAGSYPVDPQKYWDRVSRVDEAFVDDASFVRLRNVSLNYTLGSSMLASTPLKSITLGVSANNLAYLYKKTDNISPESSFSVGNGTGYEMFSLPESRSFTFNLKIDF
ncbi:TonB-linked outer membrane protein, SusC/RagA family [Saccharicrinis carchari]|uniref:TonB-linked outer membrane protein, SusC/RagA family n=1 Tax=Saccharicrinis carchari TaxID=1168039 RepID=A0A521F6B5_SACCC|nr:SusC/RagA family TonB-linked outer membrane protein [Saccharicrinis carchari]SMO91748.1 TonB-linked outer membrane protein, SusC/RagA family [Saccharicrinis carchari]